MFAKSGPLPGLHKGASLHEEFARPEADLGSATYPGAATPTALFSAPNPGVCMIESCIAIWWVETGSSESRTRNAKERARGLNLPLYA